MIAHESGRVGVLCSRTERKHGVQEYDYQGKVELVTRNTIPATNQKHEDQEGGG